MRKETFTAKSASGFLLDSSSKRSIEARYVERIASVEVLTDPFGKPYRVESTYFSEQKFLLSADSPEFVVIDSNSSSRALTGRLSEFSDFRIAIQSLAWAPERIFESLTKRVRVARVYAAKVDDQNLSNGIQVRMAFEGGDTDIRPQIRRFLRREKIEFASLKIDFEHAGVLRR